MIRRIPNDFEFRRADGLYFQISRRAAGFLDVGLSIQHLQSWSAIYFRAEFVLLFRDKPLY